MGPNVVRVVLTSPHDHITPRQGERSEIETLISGSLRVKVYVGIDPLSGKRHYLMETIPAGPKALDAAKKARTRLINQVDEQRTRVPAPRSISSWIVISKSSTEVTTRARYDVFTCARCSAACLSRS